MRKSQPIRPHCWIRGRTGHVIDQVPVLGGINNAIAAQFRNGPLGENGAIAMHKAYRDARAQYGPNSPEAQQALENWGRSAVNVVAGITGGENETSSPIWLKVLKRSICPEIPSPV